jgi:hypothetical protein
MTAGSAFLIVGVVLFTIVIVMLIYRRGRLDPRVRDLAAAEPDAEGDARSASRDATPPAEAPAEVPPDRVGTGRT